MRRWLIVPAASLFLAVTGAAVWTALRGGTLSANGAVAPVARKTYSTGIAEGFRLRDCEHMGVDLLAFEAMRIENLRRGGITLGAFNVLALDGLTVNLVENRSHVQKSSHATDGESAVPPPFDFIGRLKNVQGVAGKKCSSVRITRLAVNRLTDGETERLFTAETAEAGLGAGKALCLKGYRVFDGGAEGVPVHDARVEVEPEPTLVYSQQGGRAKRISLISGTSR